MGELPHALQRILIGAAPVTAAELPALVRLLEGAAAAGDDADVAAACRALSRYDHTGALDAEGATMWLRGITSASPAIRTASASFVQRAVGSPAAAACLLAHRPLLDGLVDLLKSDDDGDTAASDAACRALATSASHAAEPAQLHELVAAVAALAPRGADAARSVAFARFAAVVSQIAGAGEAACSAIDAGGLLGATLHPVARSDDILLQLAVLDVLPPLARNGAGYVALERSGALQAVHSWAGIGAADASACDPLLADAALAAAVDIYAALAARDPAAAAAATERAGLVQRVFDAVVVARADGDEPSVVRAIATLTALVRADARALSDAIATPRLASAWLGAGSGSAPSGLQAAAFESVARVLDAAAPRAAAAAPLATAAAAPAARCATQLALVDACGRECLGPGGDAVAAALAALRRPAPDLRAAAYHFLAALAALPCEGGLRRLFGGAGAAELLLGAAPEPTAEGREWRHSVVVAAAENPVVGAALGDSFVEALGRVRRAGPHPVPVAVHAVATAH